MVDGLNWHNSNHQQNAFRRTPCICQASGWTLGSNQTVICSYMEGYCQDHVQLWTLIRLLRSHRSTVAQLRTSAHYSGPGRAHTLPLSVTLCIRLNPVVTTLPHLPCCTVSSPCSVCIFYLVVFSPDLTYFHWTWPSPNSGRPLSAL